MRFIFISNIEIVVSFHSGIFLAKKEKLVNFVLQRILSDDDDDY